MISRPRIAQRGSESPSRNRADPGAPERNKKRKSHLTGGSSRIRLRQRSYSSPSSSSSKPRPSDSLTRSSIVFMGTAIPLSLSAASLADPRSNQLPTLGVGTVPPVVPTISSSGAVSIPKTSMHYLPGGKHRNASSQVSFHTEISC